MELTRTIQFYFRQPSLSGITVSELEKAVSRYPYCGPLHLLLLKKQVQERHPDLQKQFEKTSIYFPNSFLLNELLRAPEAPPKLKPAAPVAEPAAHVEPAAAIQPAADAAPATVTGTASATGTAATIQPATATEPPVFEATAKVSVDTPAIAEVPEEATGMPETETVAKADEVTTTTPPPVFEQPDAEATAREAQQEPPLRSDLLMKESPIRIPTLKDINPQTDEQPLFEPYHTIDYFASQGIKMSADLPGNDRLGRQLKSFTDWIKTMKKLPQTTIEKQLLDSGNGEKIVAMAAGSVEHREVVTETMAEVLVKQGSIENAIALYRKLSLAHPDKSAYFAARIEQLKNR